MHLLLALLLSGPSHAESLAGVTLSDSVTIDGSTCVLNGLGLREKYFIDIYVGGLYLKNPTANSSTAISSDQPKRLEMAFIYSEVTKAQLADAMNEGLVKQSNAAAIKARMDKLNGWMEDVHPGDRVAFDYAPGKGTTVYVKGTNKGTIEGVDFMKALFTVYLGGSPPTAKLKKGMMGGY